MTFTLLTVLDEQHQRCVDDWVRQSGGEIAVSDAHDDGLLSDSITLLIADSDDAERSGSIVRRLTNGFSGALVIVSVGERQLYPELPTVRRITVSDLSRVALESLEKICGSDLTDASALTSENEDGQVEGLHQTRVFLSYRRVDESTMNTLRIELEERGYQVWWDKDKKNIPPGAFWPSKVEDGIQQSDAFVALISPHVLENPKRMQSELYLADAAGKKVVALIVEPITALPEGWTFIFAGQQRIDLFRDFSEGLESLCKFLGPIQTMEAPVDSSVRAKALRGVRLARRKLRDPDLRKQARDTGLAVLGTLGAVAVAAIASNRSASAEGRRNYIDETLDLLTQAVEEIRFAQQFDPEFQQRFQRLIGNLEKATPPPDLAKRHKELVTDLDKLGEEYDSLLSKLRNGDESGATFALNRLNKRWSRVINSNIGWLRAAMNLDSSG